MKTPESKIFLIYNEYISRYTYMGSNRDAFKVSIKAILSSKWSTITLSFL